MWRQDAEERCGGKTVAQCVPDPLPLCRSPTIPTFLPPASTCLCLIQSLLLTYICVLITVAVQETRRCDNFLGRLAPLSSGAMAQLLLAIMDDLPEACSCTAEVEAGLSWPAGREAPRLERPARA